MQESASWVVIARVCECAGQEPEQVMHAYNRAAALAEGVAPPRKLVRYHYISVCSIYMNILVCVTSKHHHNRPTEFSIEFGNGEWFEMRMDIVEHGPILQCFLIVRYG